jgi:hypothetical protein
MPATINQGGDVLARGGTRCTFRSPNVSQQRWNEIFGEDSGPKPNVAPKKKKKVKKVKKVEGE